MHTHFCKKYHVFFVIHNSVFLVFYNRILCDASLLRDLLCYENRLMGEYYYGWQSKMSSSCYLVAKNTENHILYFLNSAHSKLINKWNSCPIFLENSPLP